MNVQPVVADFINDAVGTGHHLTVLGQIQACQFGRQRAAQREILETVHRRLDFVVTGLQGRLAKLHQNIAAQLIKPVLRLPGKQRAGSLSPILIQLGKHRVCRTKLAVFDFTVAQRQQFEQRQRLLVLFIRTHIHLYQFGLVVLYDGHRLAAFCEGFDNPGGTAQV